MSVCSICHGGCCRRYYVDFTGYDLYNISKHLELEIPFFAETVEVKDEDVTELSKDAALFKFTDNNCKNFVRFCLRRINSTVMPSSTRCLFLLEWDGEFLGLKEHNTVLGRCGIYQLRPLTCAIYPVRIDEKNGLIGCVSDPYEICEKKNNPAYNVCPRPLIKEDFADYTGEISKFLALHKYEMAFFKALADDWNEDPGSLSEFLERLVKIYSNRIQFKPYKKTE